MDYSKLPVDGYLTIDTGKLGNWTEVEVGGWLCVDRMSVESRWKWNPLDATTIQTKERKLELKSGRKSYQIDCRGLGFICSLRHYLLE